MPKKVTTQEFIAKAELIHKDKYDYSLVDYVNAKTKVKIICPEHGVFKQLSNSHLAGHGCRVCSIIHVSNSIRSTKAEFIKQALVVHGDKYKYNLVHYENNKVKVKIICPEHGVYLQSPGNHLLGSGCTICNTSYGQRKLSTADFIDKAKKVHGNRYDYNFAEYKKTNIRVVLVCAKHGIFKQTPEHHLRGQGCPKCGMLQSVGVQQIEYYLTKNNLQFKQEYRIEGCKDKLALPFDFALLQNQKLLGLIEFDGAQHYQPVKFYGGFKTLRYTQLHDLMKTLYCEANDIPLLRIPYWRQHEIPELIDRFTTDKPPPYK